MTTHNTTSGDWSIGSAMREIREAISSREVPNTDILELINPILQGNSQSAKAKTPIEESLVKLLMPYVEQWLAHHLPQLVRDAVAQEIKKLGVKKGQ